MFNVASLKNASSPRKPLGTVPWILPNDNRIEGESIGIESDGSVNFEGVGYVLFDAPVYPMSSSQRRIWESNSQKILSMLVAATDGRDELFQETSVDSEGNSIEADLTQQSKVALMSAMANNSEMIRSLHAEMMETVLRMPIGSSDIIATVTGLGEVDTDLFAECFQAISEMLKPKPVAVDPNESKMVKKLKA